MKKRIAAAVCAMAMSLSYTGFAEEMTDMLSEKVIETAENESNIGIKIYSNEDKREILREKVENFAACTPEDVASEAELEAYKAALLKAREVLNNPDAQDAELEEAAIELENAVEGLKYIKKEVILTNNKFADKSEYYPDNEIITTAARYTYSAGSKLKAADSAATMLSDGEITNIASETETAEIVYDLGKEYYITGADVYSRYAKNPIATVKIKGFDIETSTDGTVYNKIAYKEASGTNADLRTDSHIPAVLARYVKIRVYKSDDAKNYILREIVIKGIESGFSKDELYNTIAACYDVSSLRCTPESYSAFKAAFEEAEAIYWDETITDKRITSAKNKLLQAYNNLEYTSKTAILSGNATGTADLAHYSAYSRDTLSDIKYWYGEDSDENVNNSDPNCTKLLQGECAIASQSGKVVEGSWGGAKNSIVIIFDLGENCFVNGVDLWEWYRKTAHIGTVKIEASTDNVNYKQVSEKQSDCTYDSDGCSYVFEQDFEAEACRYLRITVTRALNKSMINEIVVKGYKNKSESAVPYLFGCFDYKNAGGERVREADGGIIKVSGNTIKNNSDKVNPSVVTVAYDEKNTLIAWDFTNVSGGEFENTLDLGGKTNVRIYTFVVDSLDGGIPLSEIKPFGKI